MATMDAATLIADANAMQAELASLPTEAARLIHSLMELAEEQERLIRILLDANHTLLKERKG